MRCGSGNFDEKLRNEKNVSRFINLAAISSLDLESQCKISKSVAFNEYFFNEYLSYDPLES